MSDPDSQYTKRAAGTAQMLEQVARRILEKRDQQDLHAAQWSALRYFARAGRRTANVSGLSKYLGNTSGSTSRTARSLVDRDLLEATKAEYDARSVTFRLTENGSSTLEQDPLLELTQVLATVPPEDLIRLSEILEFVHSEMSRIRSA